MLIICRIVYGFYQYAGTSIPFPLTFCRCGLRGGYFEVVNFDKDSDTLTMLKKCISVKLCPAVTGQTAMECVVNAPRSCEPSYELHEKVSMY